MLWGLWGEEGGLVCWLVCGVELVLLRGMVGMVEFV